jgi:hypothetical protein
MQELSAIEAASNISCNYRKTLALLRALKAGTVSLDNVTMTDDGWTVAEVIVEPPAEPAEDAADPLENAIAAKPPKEGQ